ncbi:UDP-glycosyltransferase 71A15 [Bienertia sinuspersici]
MIDVAAELNVPSYIFITSDVNTLNMMFHCESLDDKGIDICDEFSDPNNEFDVPGFETRVKGSVVPAVFLDRENGSSLMLDRARRIKKTKGILVNSFEELETCGIQTLLEQVAEDGSPKQDDEELTIIQWLDNQPSSSAVFLCFGSMGTFDEAQVKEIAKGAKCGSPLIRMETFVEALPEGFLEGIADRGKIIGQWFGVPIATWPIFAEQQLNAFELVNELGLAVEIRMDYRRDYNTKVQNFTMTADDIANGVNKLMSLDEETNNRVKEMKCKSRRALEEGGSSHKWLACFIEDVLSNVA